MVEQRKCYLCGSDEFTIVHHGVRGAKDIDVLKCQNCGLVRLSKFISNTDEFYADSGMRDGQITTIKEIRAEANADDHRRFEMTKENLVNKKVLDFGCGAGGYLHKAKKVAKEVSGVELEQAMREELIKEGIICFPDIKEAAAKLDRVDIITLWHVLEHLEDPISMLKQLKEKLELNGKIYIEVPNADDALLSLYENKNFADFTYWRCHLYLYTNKTLREVIEKAGLRVSFVTQIQRYPLSNTLYWLAKGKPGGHVKWSSLNDETLRHCWENKLAGLGIADTIVAIAEMQ